MAMYDIEPWPSTYKMGDEKVEPTKITPSTKGRIAGAFRTIIPARTVEPPQVHLIAERDGKPFQELLTGLDKSLLVAYFDLKTKTYKLEKYSPDQDIVIPEFKIHWLINTHDTDLSFTCEYAPHPWDGDNDEPEFPNLTSLLEFVKYTIDRNK